MDKPIIPFTPVPLRARSDGWTPQKQIAFIEALAETGLVEDACARVGMSDTSAYNLRLRPSGVAFRRAWEAAMDYSLHLVEQDAFTRSRRGVARPIFYKGEQVGEWRHYDERLTMFMLRTHRPRRYGWIDRAPVIDDPDGEPESDDPAIRLDGGLEEIAWRAEACSSDDDEDGPDDGEDDHDSSPPLDGEG